MTIDSTFDKQSIFNQHSDSEFEDLCLAVFNYQYLKIEVYRRFVDALKIKAEDVSSISSIPFMPIEFFKNFAILAENEKAQITFKSSGTTGMQRSQHFVKDLSLYEESFSSAFKLFYDDIEDYVILALLPSYIENGDSSLVYMANHLIKASKNDDSGFYLNDYSALIKKLKTLQATNKKVLLLGVTYALLDVIEIEKFHFPELIIMETGGMKGRRKELIREDLHGKLCAGFGVSHIHSEYGMTELLSQAYSKGEGVFSCPSWMKILIRDTNDPLSYMKTGKSGAINVIDLANINSVSFLATQDLGKIVNNGDFTILGRFDNSDIRGCNLLVV